MASQCFAARTSAIFVHGMVWCRVPTILKLHDEHFCLSWDFISENLVYNLYTYLGQLTLNSKVLIDKGEMANIDVS